jgi:hypothetical protein
VEAFIRNLPLPAFILMVVFGLAMAAVPLVAAIYTRRRTALVKRTPTSNIAMALEGYCEFEGTAEAIDGQLLTAPLTHSPCVWYHAKVEKWARGRDSESEWQTVKEATSSTPFFVRDATGVCLVDPYDAEITPSDKSQWTGASVEPSDRNPARLSVTESTTPLVEVAGTGSAKYRYFEERIYAGGPLLVLGEFSANRSTSVDDELEDDDVASEDVAVAESRQDTNSVEATGFGDDWKLCDQLTERAQRTTRSTISRGSGGKPFIVTTVPQATHVYMSDVGSEAALYLSLTFLIGVAILLWARFG